MLPRKIKKGAPHALEFPGWNTGAALHETNAKKLSESFSWPTQHGSYRPTLHRSRRYTEVAAGTVHKVVLPQGRTVRLEAKSFFRVRDLSQTLRRPKP